MDSNIQTEVQTARSEKDEGNSWFKNGDWVRAEQCYQKVPVKTSFYDFQAIKRLVQIRKEETNQELDKLQITCMSNLTQCFLNQDKFDEAIHQANMVNLMFSAHDLSLSHSQSRFSFWTPKT